MRFLNKNSNLLFANLKKYTSCFKTMSTNSIASSDPKTFENLKFDNLVLRTLPIDPITENYVREVKNACFSRVI